MPRVEWFRPLPRGRGLAEGRVAMSLRGVIEELPACFPVIPRDASFFFARAKRPSLEIFSLQRDPADLGWKNEGKREPRSSSCLGLDLGNMSQPAIFKSGRDLAVQNPPAFRNGVDGCGVASFLNKKA